LKSIRRERPAITSTIRPICAASARQVTAEDFLRFDLILAMDRDNLQELEAMRPAESRARVRLFLEYAPELGRTEVPDPYYGDARGFEEVLNLSVAASRGLIADLQKMA